MAENIACHDSEQRPEQRRGKDIDRQAIVVQLELETWQASAHAKALHAWRRRRELANQPTRITGCSSSIDRFDANQHLLLKFSRSRDGNLILFASFACKSEKRDKIRDKMKENREIEFPRRDETLQKHQEPR